MSDPAERGQELGLPSCTALVVASMIGAGVFTTSGYTLADLRSRGAVLAAWALGGGLATCGALSYAALSRRFPVSGGEYEYLTRALHPVAGTLAGWVSLLAGFTVPLAVAAGAFDVYVGAIVERDTGRLCGSMAIVAAGVAHGLQVRVGALLQNTIVLAKVLLIGGLIGFGACVIAQRGAPPPLTGARDGAFLPAFATGLVWISFAYSGWNAAVYVASEVRTPERTVARSLLLGTFAVTAMYLGLNAVFLFAAPADRLAGRPEVAAVAAEALGGSWLRVAVSALVALALLTSIASLVMTGPRVYARMAEDGVLPRVFAFRRLGFLALMHKVVESQYVAQLNLKAGRILIS